MMLTAKARYAVTAMVDLASRYQSAPIPLSEIALRQGITIAYLEQIFAKLRKAGVVYSVRGPGGGYKLKGHPSDISIADIIMAIEEPVQMTQCGNRLQKRCTKEAGRCVTHDLWAGLEQLIGNYLASISLLDVSQQKLLYNNSDLITESSNWEVSA